MANQVPSPKIRVLIITGSSRQDPNKLAYQVVEMLNHEKVFEVYSEAEEKLISTSPYTSAQGLDYIICLGENSTMLRALRVASGSTNIPILSISDGDVPIMASYNYCELTAVMKKFVQEARQKELKILHTPRFKIFLKNGEKPNQPLTNFSFELEMHRDMYKSVLKLKIYAKIEGKEFLHLANVWGDGLIISTPCGSLGRNLTLSGPIMYKTLDSIIIVPIVPLSLKFRPIILPSSAEIVIEVEESSRSAARVTADGEQIMQELAPGARIILTKSSKTTQLVKGLSEKSTEEQWISCLRSVLSWGESYNSSTDKIERLEDSIEPPTTPTTEHQQ